MLDTTKELIAALEGAAARILRAGWDEGGAGAEVVAVDAPTGKVLGPVDRAHCAHGQEDRSSRRTERRDGHQLRRSDQSRENRR